MTGRNDRDRDDLLDELDTRQDGDQEDQVEVVDRESTVSLDEWLDKHNPEHLAHVATLYKYLSPVGTAKEQKHRWRGEPVPETHELGIQYGGGRYYMVTVVPKGKKQPKRVYVKRFVLGVEYDTLKRKNDEAEAAKERALSPVNQQPVPSITSSFKDTFEMVNSMFGRVIEMMKPIMERALQPPQAPQNNVNDQLGMFAAMKSLLKDNTRDNLSFFSEMQRKITNMNPDDITAAYDNAPEPEQKSMLERLFAMLEPFIPMFIQNSTQAKVAAAGLRAIPAVGQAINQVAARPDAMKHVVGQIANKYGRQEAVNFLKNAGIQNVSDYIAPDTLSRSRVPVNGKKATVKRR